MAAKMGQALQRAVTPALVPVLTSHLQAPEDSEEDSQETPRAITENNEEEQEQVEGEKFPDLSNIPPEIALQVLKNLNATDLCLASCVWQQLASDNILWQGLCR